MSVWKDINRLVVALVFVAAPIACGTPANGTVVNYPVHCEGTVDRLANKCSGELSYTLNRQTFSVDAQQQRVIRQFETPGALPVRLEGCTVKDVENWVCGQRLVGRTEIYTQTMSHGVYNESGLGLVSDDVVYVSRAEWTSLAKRRTNQR